METQLEVKGKNDKELYELELYVNSLTERARWWWGTAPSEIRGESTGGCPPFRSGSRASWVELRFQKESGRRRGPGPDDGRSPGRAGGRFPTPDGRCRSKCSAP